MNKKGGIFFGIAIGILIFVFGVIFLPYFIDDVTTTRGLLTCDLDTITYGTMLMCLEIDLLLPYIIWFIFSALIGYLIGK